MTEDRNSIGENIRRERKAAGMTQEELGKKIGISQQAVGNYESGRRKPKIKTLVRFSNGLNVSVAELLAGMLDDTDPVNRAFTRGYQAGYETAKKEVLERMKTWLGGKEDKSDGEDKNHEKAPG